ncbi:MAG TPA: 4'-phosphopantetheinyl transferase superfamily protein [Rhodanobacteraceae bacterium]|jgi:4'-phosphopantetheinyl transferase
MIGPDDFVAALPAQVAPGLGDAVHLWRLPYARNMGRAPLRALLAAYLATDAAALELRNDEHGKPQLFAHGESHRVLQFNWSHSGSLALVALARTTIPGVDIEQPREGVKILEIARRFFAPGEADALADCGGTEREALFFRLWCGKEAVLKALGRGLAFGLERVAFEREGGGWRQGRFDPEAGSPADWQVHAVAPAPGYVGAVAWRGPAKAIRAWR